MNYPVLSYGTMRWGRHGDVNNVFAKHQTFEATRQTGQYYPARQPIPRVENLLHPLS